MPNRLDRVFYAIQYARVRMRLSEDIAAQQRYFNITKSGEGGPNEGFPVYSTPSGIWSPALLPFGVSLNTYSPASIPPSTTTAEPVMNDASSLARKSTTLAISEAVATRPHA